MDREWALHGVAWGLRSVGFNVRFSATTSSARARVRPRNADMALFVFVCDTGCDVPRTWQEERRRKGNREQGVDRRRDRRPSMLSLELVSYDD
jgi:hypothetical protein